MSRRLSAVVLFVCILSITGSAQSPGQSGARTQGIILEFHIIETTTAPRNEIEKMDTGKDQINRLIAEGKARVFAGLQVRTRTGENFVARVGERRPIQTATLPVMRTSDGNARDPRQPLQFQGAFGFPQIAYENTGVVVEGVTTSVADGLLDIRIKIEMTGFDPSTGTLTPTFTQRSFADVVRMKESDTAMLIGFVQPGSRSLSLDQIAGGASKATGAGFVVLLTTKPVP